MNPLNAAQFLLNDLAYLWIFMHRKYNLNIRNFINKTLQRLIYMTHRFTEIFTAVRRHEDDAVLPEAYARK